MKYRKKPVTVEAVQWTGDNVEEIQNFASASAIFEYIVRKGNQISLSYNKPHDGYVEGINLNIHTLEGVMTASLYDYIIKGVNGEYYPCKPDIFEKTYEKVND